MRNLVSEYVSQFRQDRQKQMKLVAVLAALAVIVAGVVFWQLHNTGVAMTNEVFCGQEEHIHDVDCYDEDGTTLLCTIPEHTHTVECLIDETADVETEKDWEATLPEELSGVWSDDVTAIAESQVGYTESEQNFQLAEDGVTHQGYTRYGAWYGNDYGDWDAMFVSFCLNYAGVPEEEVPESSGTYALAVALADLGLYVDDEDFTPCQGDLVFFDTDEDEKADRVGIVKELATDEEETTWIVVVEGDSNDAVEETEYEISDPMIVAYGVLPDQPEEEATAIEASGDMGTDVDAYNDTVTGAENETAAAAGTKVIPVNTEVDPETGEITYQAEGITYTEKTLDLWIHDSEGNVIGDYDENDGLPCDVLVYMDPESEEEYLLIPVDVFEDALAEEEYTFDDSDDCPFSYAVPAADDEYAENTEDFLETCEYYSLAADEETAWYVRVPATEEETADQLDVYYVMPLATPSNTVTLNLGNGNGAYNFADYAGNKKAGQALRYTVSVEGYDEDIGGVIIHLPDDNDLDNTFTIIKGMDGKDDVTIDLGKEANYDYKLVGWVNIATGTYYDVSDINVDHEAVIYPEDENVFYADWIAASYDHGEEGDSDLRDTVSTGDFVTIHMYDFNELFNLYSESLEEVNDDGKLVEHWTDSGTLYSSPLLANNGGNLTEVTNSFIFVNDGTTEQGYVEDENGKKTDELLTGGMLTWPNSKQTWNTWTSTPKEGKKGYVIDSKDTWNIGTPSNSELLNMLFDPTSSSLGVHYVGEADNLFWVDKNGYYTYDSKESAATYNQSDESFYVYTKPQYVRGTSYSCFLPFNSFVEATEKTEDEETNSPYHVDDGTVDYWFGMDMTVDFYLPSSTGLDKSISGNIVNGQDMVFNFSGDDDIWVFVDDQLVLDMSGIHDEAFGSIDFVTGKAEVGMSKDETGKIGISQSETDVKISSGNHTLRVFYMERGGYASNLEIQFNVVPVWDYETGPVQTVTAKKIWEDSYGNVIVDPTTTISSLYSSVEVGLFDVLPEASEGVIGYTKNGDEYEFEYRDDSNVYHKFVYDSSVPSLTYSEGTTEITYTLTDSDGRVLDDNGLVICWLEEDTGLLHMRMDIQTLSSANEWYYAWELLDADGEYEVLELTEGPSYTTTSSSSDINSYLYWSIIGEKEIEANLEDPDFRIILTEAAQEATGTLGDTKEANGYVIVANSDGTLKVEQVKFSQMATLTEKKDVATGTSSFYGTYGVTSQSEIANLGDGAIWYLEDANHEDPDVGGGTVEGFYLYCMLDGSKYYLSLDEETIDDEVMYDLSVTADETAKSEFFYDNLGELMIELTDGSMLRVEILSDGEINIGVGEEVAAVDDVRIYTLTDTETSGFWFTAVNTFLPDITLNKVDSVTNEPLAGISFTLQCEAGQYEGMYYAGFDEVNDRVIWSDDPYTIITEEVSGQIVFRYLPDGTYILTEVSTADGYNLLPSSITIYLYGDAEDRLFGAVWTDETVRDDPKYDGFINVTSANLSITLENQYSVELPNAGGTGTWIFTVIGVCLIGGAAVTLVYRKRRAVRS